MKGEKIKKKKKNTMPTPKQMANIDLLHQHTQEKLQEMQHEQKAGVYNFKVRLNTSNLIGKLSRRQENII